MSEIPISLDVLLGAGIAAEKSRLEIEQLRADLVASAQTAARFERERDELDAENLLLREQAGEMAMEIDRLRNAPQPRVWLAGDIVPAGIYTLAPNNFLIMPQPRDFRAATPLVEMHDVPAFGELVAKEKKRRALAEALVDGAASEPTDTGLAESQRDALVRAHQMGDLYPAGWNALMRQSLVDRGLVEQDDAGWCLTKSGVDLAQRIEAARQSQGAL